MQLTEHNICKVVLGLFMLKALIGYGTPLDGFIILVACGLNIFLYFHDQIFQAKVKTEEIEQNLNLRIEKLESVTSSLSLNSGLKRNG